MFDKLFVHSYFLHRSQAPAAGAPRFTAAENSGGPAVRIYSIHAPNLTRNTRKQSDTFDLLLGIFVVGMSVATGTMWNPARIADPGSSWFGKAARVVRSVRPEPNQARQPAIEYFADVDVPPAPIRVAPAVMTQQARAARFHGTVSMIVYVDSLGVPREMEPASPVPFGLGNTIRLAVFQWRFRPAQRGGVAVAAKTAVEVPFQ